jgi:glutamate decarboxylase
MALSTAQPGSGESMHSSTFASRYVRTALPRFRMPEQSIPKDAAYQIINDELMLDGNPRLNLASFVTTWMEPECDKLIQASINKNYVDMDEYPVTTELQVPDDRPVILDNDPYTILCLFVSVINLITI